MGLLCCAAKCCGCMALSQLCALLLPLGILAALGLLFYTYVIPWGEDQIRQTLGLASDVDIGSLNTSYIESNSCSGCVFGSNTQWPTNTTGTLHFLDSEAGSTASGVIATSLAGAAVIGTGSMLWASVVPSAAAALSFSAGFYEMTHIVEQAQFAGMISQLRIEGAPTFLLQFSKELSWTNFNVVKGSSDDSSGSGGDRRLADSSSSATGVVAAAGESGPARYAALIGVDVDDLFFYTLVTFVVVIAALHVLYLLVVLIMSCLSKNESFGDVARNWYRKVVWAGVLALLLAQYMFAMAGSFFVSEGSSNDSANGSSSRYALGIVALAAVVFLALGLGIIVVGNNTDELKDVGTYEHDQRPFSSKYSAYYDEYNFDNRFFFVPRILLAVMTGAIVGVVRDATTQLLCILAITIVYLILLLIRQPNLLRFLYYLGITSVFMKVVLICLMLIVARDDYFPQNVRDNVAYGIIGVNIFIFFVLFVRQAFTIIHKMVVVCRHKKNGKDNSRLDATDINLEFGNDMFTNRQAYEQVETTPAGRGVDWYANKQLQEQQRNQPTQQQYQSQTSAVSGYSTTESSRSGQSENVPMLEPAPEPVPVFSRSRGKIHPPVSRNQQYSFGGSSRDAAAFEVNNAAPAPAPTPAPEPAQEIPTYDVLAAYLGTNKSTDEATYSTSPKSGRGQSSRGQSFRGQSSRGHLSSRGQNSSRGQSSSRGLASSRGPPSSRGGAAVAGSGLGSRPSTVPLDAYAGSFSGTNSGVSTTSSRRKRSFDMDALRSDVDIDDVDIDDFAAEPAAPSTARQQFNPGASTVGHHFNPAASSASSYATMEQSYVNFSDSVVSSASSQMDMTQSTVKQDNTFSAAMAAPKTSNNGGYGSSPQAKMSIFSNDSENSFDGDSSGWFKTRSKTVVSTDSSDHNDVEGQSYELGPHGVTKSAFNRDSMDSYGYQSVAHFATSRVDFNAQSQTTDNGSDDGRYYPTHRRGTGSSNQSSNQSFLSAHSDDSSSYYDVDKVRHDHGHSNTLTL
ncbi:hypothetical protein V7S43_008170 [Phytophthora oleae]|uniref:TRP C-terminal domain-containing protein n=1 Tax=Phytophthora oleae TaxID=2107226 RepID=A0ABD3FJH3_9STRA